MNKKLLTFLFLGILLIGLVSAAPPASTAITVNAGVDINFPLFTTHQEGFPFTFHFHTLNDSNGALLTDSDLTCIFHLYSSDGKHQIEMNHDVAMDSNNIDWTIFVEGANFSRGLYSYLFECNSTAQKVAGSVEDNIEVTSTGDSENTLGLFILIYLILFIIICIGIYTRNESIAIIGAMGFMFMGVYTLTNGIVIFRNVATETISWITIGFGTIVALAASVNLIEESI